MLQGEVIMDDFEVGIVIGIILTLVFGSLIYGLYSMATSGDCHSIHAVRVLKEDPVSGLEFDRIETLDGKPVEICKNGSLAYFSNDLTDGQRVYVYYTFGEINSNGTWIKDERRIEAEAKL